MAADDEQLRRWSPLLSLPPPPSFLCLLLPSSSSSVSSLSGVNAVEMFRFLRVRRDAVHETFSKFYHKLHMRCDDTS